MDRVENNGNNIWQLYFRVKEHIVREYIYIAAIINVPWNVKMRKEERRNVDSKETAVGKERNLSRSFYHRANFTEFFSIRYFTKIFRSPPFVIGLRKLKNSTQIKKEIN